MIAAVEGLDADLELVEGLHHDEAFERYRDADIVVDQLNAGWYGLFAIEAMALGKPVVTFLHDEAVAPHRGGVRHARPDRLRDRRDARASARARSSPTRRGGASSAPPRAPTSSASTTSSASPTACSTSTLVSSDDVARACR